MIDMANNPLQISCLYFYIRMADRHLAKIYDDYLRPFGIRITQLGMLECLSQLNATYISDIGRILLMDQTTVTRNIEKLEKAGYVMVTPHQTDPRKKIVKISRTGEEKLASAHKAWQEAQEFVALQLGQEDFDVSSRLLKKISSI